MKKFTAAAFIIVILSVIIHEASYAQMPDWKGFKDKEGNKYFYDKNGKVWTLGTPVFTFKPVSVDGIEYYINHGEYLIKSRYQVQGLTILKSILAMPASDFRINKAQSRASKIINGLIKREGSRYPKLDFDSSLLLYRINKKISIINEIMRYSIKIDGEVTVIRKRDRVAHGYEYQGVLLGIQSEGENHVKGAYDFIVAIDSEKFSIPVTSLGMIQDHWDMVTGPDGCRRNEILKTENSLVMEFRQKDDTGLSGFEGIYFDRNFGYFVKILVPVNRLPVIKEKMRKVIDSFSFVAGN